MPVALSCGFKALPSMRPAAVAADRLRNPRRPVFILGLLWQIICLNPQYYSAESQFNVNGNYDARPASAVGGGLSLHLASEDRLVWWCSTSSMAGARITGWSWPSYRSSSANIPKQAQRQLHYAPVRLVGTLPH